MFDKIAHARARCTDHLGQHFLSEFSHNRLWPAFFAEIREEKEKSGEALLARIEQLINQVFFNPTVASLQIRHEQFGEFRFFVNRGNHGRLLQTSNHAFICRPGCRDAQRMSIETSFAEKVAWTENSDDCFFAMLRNDDQLDIAFLDIKNCIRDRSL